MRSFIVKLGLFKSVIAITIFVLPFSSLITLMVIYCYALFGVKLNVIAGLSIASFTSIIVTPPTSWFVVGLLLQIDQLEVEMRRRATYDSLTGLLNRHVFAERANDFFCLAAREKLGFSLLVVDIDHFKAINDQHGHAYGDKVLEIFGDVVYQTMRKSDLAGRLGGEEFAFLLPATSANQALDFAERLHKKIRKSPIHDNELLIQITVSIGIAAYPANNANDIDSLLRLADKAMYCAKEKGRNQSVVYDENCETLESAK